MALMKCPDCGREISTLALACPGCGRPMEPEQQAPQAIERTSKKWKRLQAVGAAILIAGCIIGGVGLVGEYYNVGWTGVVLLIIGVGILIYGAVAAWWHHG